jgi:hypothetical protein
VVFSPLFLSVDMIILLGMEQEDFRQTWSELMSERRRLFDQRTNLETELVELRYKITHLDEILSHLSPLAGFADEDDLSSMGLTDAIRTVLKTASPNRLAPGDVRETLQQRGYDLSGLTAPMASIYKILGRISEGNDSEVEREKQDGRVYYKWKSPPITDEDIPF